MKSNVRYIEGNTVRKIESRPRPSRLDLDDNRFIRSRQLAEAKKKRLRKERAKSIKYSIITTLVFIGLVVLGVRYISIYNDYSIYRTEVVTKEKYLQQIMESNAELETRLGAPVDLMEIARIAKEEYGMIEATKDQVKFYVDSNDSYVKQYADIPEDEKTTINVVGFITFGR